MVLGDQSLKVWGIILAQEVNTIIIQGTEIKFFADTYIKSPITP